MGGKAWIDANLDRKRLDSFPSVSAASSVLSFFRSLFSPNFQDILSKLVLDCLDVNEEKRPTTMDCMRSLKQIDEQMLIDSLPIKEINTLRDNIEKLKDEIKKEE